MPASVSNAKRGPYASDAQRERRRKILEVAHRLLSDGDASVLTIERIADLSKVSQKILYNIFGGRDQLLIEAASQHLDRMQRGEQIVEAEPGIPQLLALTEAAMEQFRDMPDYMRSVISIVIKTNPDLTTAQQRVLRIQEFAQVALQVANEQGELLPDTDVSELSQIIAANQWGIALMWERGLLTLEQMIRQAELNHYSTLMSYCVGHRRQWLESRFDALRVQANENL